MKMKVLLWISLSLNSCFSYAWSPILNDIPREYSAALEKGIFISKNSITNFKGLGGGCSFYQNFIACGYPQSVVKISFIEDKPVIYRLYFSNEDYKEFDLIKERILGFLKYTESNYDKNKLDFFLKSIHIPAKGDIKEFDLSNDLIISFYSPDRYHRLNDRNNLIMIYKNR